MFRLTVFFNVTVFIAALVLFNQIFPGEIARIAREDSAVHSLLWTVVPVGAVVSVGAVAYMWGGVSAARDLHHLLELHEAGMEDGRLETRRARMGETTDMMADLRRSQLSDI